MKSMVALLVILASTQALAETALRCDYQFYGSPMAQVTLRIQDSGIPADSAEVTMGGAGRPQSVPVTVVPNAPNEKIHVWLAKDDPNGDIEMVVYNEPQAKGQSKLVNSHIPMGKELWGNCTASR